MDFILSIKHVLSGFPYSIIEFEQESFPSVLHTKDENRCIKITTQQT